MGEVNKLKDIAAAESTFKRDAEEPAHSGAAYRAPIRETPWGQFSRGGRLSNTYKLQATKQQMHNSKVENNQSVYSFACEFEN
jgi:hypothetical protein